MDPQVVTYVSNTASSRKEGHSDSNVNASRNMGAAEILLGLISIALGIVAMVIASKKPGYASAWRSSLGLWCGAVVCFTGISRIVSKTKTDASCLFIWNVLFSIISVSAAATAIITSIILATLSSRVSTILVWIHTITALLHFVLVMATSAYARICCHDDRGTSVTTVSTGYSQPQYTGFVQAPPGLSSSHGFGNQPTPASPYPQSVPQNPGLMQPPSHLGSGNQLGNQPSPASPYPQSVPQNPGLMQPTSRLGSGNQLGNQQTTIVPYSQYTPRNAGFVQPPSSLSANNRFGDQPTTTSPHSQFVPKSLAAHNRCNTATPFASTDTGYVAPISALSSTATTTPKWTVSDLRNPPAPGLAARTPNTCNRRPVATPSAVTPVQYVEPNLIEHGQAPNAQRPQFPLPSTLSQSTNVDPDAAASKTDGEYISLNQG